MDHLLPLKRSTLSLRNDRHVAGRKYSSLLLTSSSSSCVNQPTSLGRRSNLLLAKRRMWRVPVRPPVNVAPWTVWIIFEEASMISKRFMWAMVCGNATRLLLATMSSLQWSSSPTLYGNVVSLLWDMSRISRFFILANILSGILTSLLKDTSRATRLDRFPSSTGSSPPKWHLLM